ncbi:MAG: hypothetical protein MI923_21950 [Phycisphaerales bacterium]|nr:hypothetical protein [Phycisphaerales bacterium]
MEKEMLDKLDGSVSRVLDKFQDTRLENQLLQTTVSKLKSDYNVLSTKLFSKTEEVEKLETELFETTKKLENLKTLQKEVVEKISHLTIRLEAVR